MFSLTSTKRLPRHLNVFVGCQCINSFRSETKGFGSTSLWMTFQEDILITDLALSNIVKLSYGLTTQMLLAPTPTCHNLMDDGITNSTVVIFPFLICTTAPETPRPPEIREETNKTMTIKLFPTSTKYGPIRQVSGQS